MPRPAAGAFIRGFASRAGSTRTCSIESRDALRKDIDQIIGWCCDALELHKSFVHSHETLHESFASFPSSYMSLVGADGGMDLYDGVLRAIDADGKPIFEGVHPADYRNYIIEEVRAWSYMKFPHIRSLGPRRRLVSGRSAGPVELRRLHPHPHRRGCPQGFPWRSAMAAWSMRPSPTHWARLICMIHCAETIRDLLFDDALQGNDLVVTGERRPEGVAIIERRAARCCTTTPSMTAARSPVRI